MLGVWGLKFPATAGEPSAQQVKFFETRVRSVLAENCFKCHGSEKQKGDLRLDSREAILMGGENGPAIVVGKPDESILIKAVRHEGEIKMPKGEKNSVKLSPEKIEALTEWVKMGAPWPKGIQSQLSTSNAQRSTLNDQKTHWAYLPVAKPVPPKVKNQKWIATPVDNFILAKLEKNRMKPSPTADRRTLIRRVYFDLIGLPPTPEEVDAFLSDKSPNAYEKIVNRLLASPRYGERWARHWLDVVHYADSHGHDQDRPRPNAWPYRDWVIRALNDDKPYSRFVQEQLAGDAIFPDDPEAITSLGFLAAGPWDESSQMHINDDTIDKKIAQNLDRDDVVTVVGQTFLSSTINCARCHAHKFDPISQKEYYALQACFAGVDRVDRPYDADARVHALRQRWQKEKTAIEIWQKDRSRGRLDPPSTAEIVGLAEWEKVLAASFAPWTVLDPVSATSAQGATLTKQPDGSILSGGAKPEKDTYTIVANTNLRGITAIRLEVLTDDSLAYKGPGRQDNGNLHLSEFRVGASPRANPDDGKALKLQNPTADFNQQDWGIERAIDRKMQTAWGIYPEVGKSHFATFQLAEPLDGEGGTILTFTLEQQHGGGHLIGRPRLSITTTPYPLYHRALPPDLAKIITTPAGQRSEAQRAELLAVYRLEQIEKQLAALPTPSKVYAATSDFTPIKNFKPAKTPRPIFLLKRGEVSQPLDPVAPAALALATGLAPVLEMSDPNDEAVRRAALARWITDPRNPLTWRSIVNRVWHYHFGRGLVDTPNDFGKMGGTPSHPELLDWLAADFRDNGRSLKHLHKLIVTSATYQQSSAQNEKFAKRDADNTLLWRMNRARLDAEQIRDAVLQIAGKLDLTMGGPSVMQFRYEDPNPDLTPKIDYTRFDLDSPAAHRRSIYRYIYRTLPDPFMDTLDCPDPSQLAPKRNASLGALQAMAMMNDPFIVRMSEHIAERILARKSETRNPNSEANSKTEARNAETQSSYHPSLFTHLYLLTLGRPPTKDEVAALAAYAAKHGLANTCRVLLNSNGFIFVN